MLRSLRITADFRELKVYHPNDNKDNNDITSLFHTIMGWKNSAAYVKSLLIKL